MNAKKLTTIIISALILTAPAANLTNAQVPIVPPPTCVRVPGGPPCPGDWKTNVKTETNQPVSSKKNTSRNQLEQMTKKLNELMMEVMLGFRHTADDIRERFDNLFNGWGKKPKPKLK